MSAFETFYFKNPIYCSFCGEKHESVQCKGFDPDSMSRYQPGDVVSGCFENHIYKEELICLSDKCINDKINHNRFSTQVWIVIEGGKYVNSFPTREMLSHEISYADENYFYDYSIGIGENQEFIFDYDKAKEKLAEFREVV